MKLLIPAIPLLAMALACDGASPWFDAIKAGDTVAITRMLDAGADVEAKNEWEGTALAEAVWSGKQEAIPILLARGANPNASGQYGTPLCLAIDKWDTIAIRMLLEDPRTDASLARRDGRTPIHLLEFSDSKFNAGIAEGLLKRGAAINSVNSSGQTPLMRSAWVGSEKWVAFLVKHGADVHVKNAAGETAYVRAAQRGQLEIMKMLEEHGGKVPMFTYQSDKSKNGLTPAQLWGLATGAILNQKNGDSHETLMPVSFSGENRAEAIRILKTSWGIESRDELLSSLGNLESSTEPTDSRAWDLCRHTNVARWGAMAGYISEAEAWERILRVSRQIQETYKSWSEMSEAYLAGRRRWYRAVRTAFTREAQKAQPGVEYVVQLLLNTQDANSPWTKNKWNTALGDSAPAPATPKPELQAPPPQAPVAASNNEWKSTEANVAIVIPADAGWTRQSNSPMQLSLRNGTDTSFHITCWESRTPELTPAMTASAKANSKARSQAAGNRSEVINGDWLTFRGTHAYQWTEKQWPPGKPPYFRVQLMFIRGGRGYIVMASTASQDPLKDRMIEPLVSRLRFLDE